MTRSRAPQGGVVGEMIATYYAQRASASLIVTEGVFPTASGKSGTKHRLKLRSCVGLALV